MDKSKVGPVSVSERRAYHATLDKLGSDAKWGRPEEKTAQCVWERLTDQLPCTLTGLLPRSKSKQPLPPEEYDRAILTAKQSLIVALDCAITAGDRGAMLTKNLLFDALALRWSRRYRRARRRGARVSYDMRVETVLRVERELLVAGLRFDTLWQVVAGPWSQAGINPLFSVRRARDRKGTPLGWRATVNADSLALEAFEGAVEEDRQYRRRPSKRRLLLAEDQSSSRRPERGKVCEERPYNVVNLGERSRAMLTLLEGTRILFDLETFRNDYETLRAYHSGGHRPSTTTQWPGYRKLGSFVKTYRRLYAETEGLDKHVWIRSRFSRNSNRRYQPLDFWPDQVQKDPFRSRWFRFENRSTDQDEYDQDGPESFRRVYEAALDGPGPYVERDITVSQIQTLAVFLGISELEALATSTQPTLKEWLAAQMWDYHEQRGALAAGYSGATDRRLIAFAKAHLMRFYGGDLGKIISKCWQDQAKYGPGWRTTNGPWAKPVIKPGTKTVAFVKGAAAEAADVATAFLVTLPPWADELEHFLGACRALAKVFDQRDHNPLRGVVFHDPLDEAEIRWHPAQRGTKRVGHDQIEVRPYGEDRRTGFVPAQPGTVDRAALARFIAPCLTHTLDAFFCSLVLQRLHAAGATNILELRDAWCVAKVVPVASNVSYEHVPGEEPKVSASPDYVDGAGALDRAIAASGEEWLRGLGGVYDTLIGYLGDDPTFGPFVHEIKARWQARLAWGKPPRFSTGSLSPEPAGPDNLNDSDPF